MNASRPTPTQHPDEWSEQETVHTPVLPAQQARQGATGHNVRYVLGAGIAILVVLFLAIYLFYFG